MTEQTHSPDFESLKQLNGHANEFWSARDLMGLLGYLNWRDFDKAIHRAIISCRESGEVVEDHFEGALKMVSLGSGSKRRVKDYYLSRFACFLVAQNGDPRKQEIAEAQRYFAISTHENELNKLRQAEEQRLMLRERVAEGDAVLAQTAQAAGVQSANFGRFQNAGYQGLYGGRDMEGIKDYKGVPAEEDLLDRMGSTELAANFFRITQANQKLRVERIAGEEEAIRVHHHTGSIVREAIDHMSGIMPEDLPAEPSIKPLLEEKRRRSLPATPPPKPEGSES